MNYPGDPTCVCISTDWDNIDLKSAVPEATPDGNYAELPDLEDPMDTSLIYSCFVQPIAEVCIY